MANTSLPLIRKQILEAYCAMPAGGTVREAAIAADVALEQAHVESSRLVQDKRLIRVGKVRCYFTGRKVAYIRPSLLGRVENYFGKTSLATKLLARLVGA